MPNSPAALPARRVEVANHAPLPRRRGCRWRRAWLWGLLLLPLPAAATPQLDVGVLAGSPPCSWERSPGNWQGRAVTLWQVIANQQRLPYVLHPYPNAQALLDATRRGAVDVGVGCLTISPERVGRYRFTLPFQESGLALMLPTDRVAAGKSLIRALLSPQLLQVMAGYLLVIALLSWLVWHDEHRLAQPARWRDQFRSYALVFQVLASGPGTNVIVTRSRGHGVVLLSWLVRIVGASLIVSTVTLDVLRQPVLTGFQPRSLDDLAGKRIAVRPGSVSAQLLRQPPLRDRVTSIPLPSLQAAPVLLRSGQADAVLADEQQLRHLLSTLPSQPSQWRLVLAGTYRESQALTLSPRLDGGLAQRIDLAISQAKRRGVLN